MHSQDGVTPPAIRQAWGLEAPSRRGPRARVALEQVVEESVLQADEAGVGSVTLACIAGRLGLATTALYRYVDSKETLDELVMDAALGVPPEIDGAGSTAVMAWVESLWSRYMAHPWLASMALRRAPRCPNAYAWVAGIAGALEGVNDDGSLSLAIAIDTLVRGYAQQALVAGTAEVDDEISAEIQRRHPVLHGTPGIDPHTDLLGAVVRLTS